MNKVVQTIFFLFFISLGFAQKKDNLIGINKTWEKFYKAFESLDYNLMAQIHTKDLVRVSGGRSILDFETYINNYKNRFQKNKESGTSYNISLRFFERINNKTTASERGIYQLTVNKGKPEEQKYYGQFHVLFKKIDGNWFITMDYDSSEGGTIGEEDYLKAYALEDIDKFIR